MWQVNCDWSTSYQYDVNDQWSLTIQTQRFKDSQFASMPAGHWVNEHTKHTFYSQYVVSYPCKGKKTGTFKKGWGDKRLRKISQLSRDPATRRCLQTPNHRTFWTFPGCKAGNHKHFGFKKYLDFSLNLFCATERLLVLQRLLCKTLDLKDLRNKTIDRKYPRNMLIPNSQTLHPFVKVTCFQSSPHWEYMKTMSMLSLPDYKCHSHKNSEEKRETCAFLWKIPSEMEEGYQVALFHSSYN